MQTDPRKGTGLISIGRILCLATMVSGLLGFASAAIAVEPALEFLNGLRERRYYDTALQYIEQIENSPSIPAEVKEVLQYERGITLLESAKELINLDAQRRQLDMAQASFEAFTKDHPNHALAGQANTSRGLILMEKARVDIWDGDKPSNEGNREAFRESARKGIAAARSIFQQARDQHEANWKKYPAYIPEDQQQARAERAKAEELLIRAQLDLAQATYWEAQTYDKGANQRKELLRKAAGEFEAIHQQYRSQLGGLFARIWQGKCFEEEGNTEGIRIALGIYGEFLENEGSTPEMRALKDRALRFRLVCLNYPERHDYQVVIQEAETWLKESRERARTDVGLGIQWELCRAQEALGMDRTLPENARKNYLNQALNRARAINRYPGELKAPSSGMIQRLLVALNRDPSDPKDFDTAYGNGGQLYDQIIASNNSIRKLQSEGKQKEALEQHQALMADAAEMTRMYNLALRLATPSTDPIMMNSARLRLAYGYLLQQRYFEAAVVADDQMTRYAETFPEAAREAGFIAMTAFDNAYSNAPESDRKFERDQLINAANKIAERWPESDRANDARNAVAKIYWNDGDLISAAEWWNKIPPAASQYGDAQVRAGKAYWRQYALATARSKEDEQASPEDLKKWKQLAIDHLTIGLENAEKTTPSDQMLSDDAVSAKLVLVSIRNLDGLYQGKEGGPRGALELLTKDPHPVLKAVEVPEGQKRPTEPGRAKSRQMASLAYQQLLRAWIGLKNLDEARKAREALETVAGGEDGVALTQVYVDFGRELEQELSRLRAAGDTQRLNEVRAGFESFLNDLYQRKDGQTLYSLLWIAETYTSLADGSSDNPTKATEYYSRAATAYRSILEAAQSDPNFATPQQVVACKLRMANCLKEQKNFPEAEGVLVDVLKATPNAPDAQFTAAELYEAWGEEDADKYKVALYGRKDPVHIWGWTYASQSLQQAVYSQPNERLEKMLFDSRYHLAEAERKYGLALSDPEQAKEHLIRARSSITGFQRVSKRWSDEEYQRFNSLYKLTLADLNEPVKNLPRALSDAERPEEEAAPNDANEPTSLANTPLNTPAPAAQTPPPSSSGSNTLLILLVLLLGIGAAGGIFYVTLKSSSKKPNRTSRGASADSADDDEELPPSLASPSPATSRPGAGGGDSSLPGFGGFAPPATKPVAAKSKKGAAFPSFPTFGDDTPTSATPKSGPSPAVAKPVARPATAKPVASRPASANPSPGAAPGKANPGSASRPAGTARSATPTTGKPVQGTPRPRPATPGGPGQQPPRPAGEQKPASPPPKRPQPPESS